MLPVCRTYAHTAATALVRCGEGRHSCESGRPMCALAGLPRLSARPPVSYQYQYLLGRDLLVAPTVDEGTTSQRVYLPEGLARLMDRGAD